MNCFFPHRLPMPSSYLCLLQLFLKRCYTIISWAIWYSTFLHFIQINVKLCDEIGRATFSYSAFQPLFDIKFRWSLDYIRKLAFSSSWWSCFIPGLSAANIQHPGISNLHRHRPLRFTPWSSGVLTIHLFFPEKFILCQGRIQTRDLSIFSRTHYHWTKMPQIMFILSVLHMVLFLSVKKIKSSYCDR